MTRLVHLTDLHFGLHRPELVGPLRDAIASARPDVVVASGDLTQRARRAQFGAAMAFLRSLAVPFLMVPGNHDLPVFNPLARLFVPFGPFRSGASADLAPSLAVDDLRLHGINTADPFQWRGGAVRTGEIDRICNALRDSPPGTTNILVSHHPFEEPPGFQRGETQGARAAMDRLSTAGLHVILSGHLHHWTVGLGVSAETARPVLQVQTGTALCARVGERDHGFAVLDAGPDSVTVTRWLVDEATRAFRAVPPQRFTRKDGLWHRQG